MHVSIGPKKNDATPTADVRRFALMSTTTTTTTTTTTAALPSSSVTATVHSSPPAAAAQVLRPASLMRSLCVVAGAGASDL